MAVVAMVVQSATRVAAIATDGAQRLQQVFCSGSSQGRQSPRCQCETRHGKRLRLDRFDEQCPGHGRREVHGRRRGESHRDVLFGTRRALLQTTDPRHGELALVALRQRIPPPAPAGWSESPRRRPRPIRRVVQPRRSTEVPSRPAIVARVTSCVLAACTTICQRTASDGGSQTIVQTRSVKERHSPRRTLPTRRDHMIVSSVVKKSPTVFVTTGPNSLSRHDHCVCACNPLLLDWAIEMADVVARALAASETRGPGVVRSSGRAQRRPVARDSDPLPPPSLGPSALLRGARG